MISVNAPMFPIQGQPGRRRGLAQQVEEAEGRVRGSDVPSKSHPRKKKVNKNPINKTAWMNYPFSFDITHKLNPPTPPTPHAQQ